MKSLCLFFGGLLLLFLSACHVDVAKPQQAESLIIASDFLKWDDTLLFQSFQKRTKARIFILELSADSIQSKLQKEGYNTAIDLILVKSFHDLIPIAKSKLNERIPKTNWVENALLQKYGNQKLQIAGLTLNPYVFELKQDSLPHPTSFNTLGHQDVWYATENNDFALDALLSILHFRTWEKDKNWFKQFKANQVFPSDSTKAIPLNTFADLKDLKPTSFYFANQHTKGVYYDLTAGAIVTQAKHYSLALTFMNYLLEPKMNQKLAKFTNTFPLNPFENSFELNQQKIKHYRLGPNRFDEESHWQDKKFKKE